MVTEQGGQGHGQWDMVGRVTTHGHSALGQLNMSKQLVEGTMMTSI